MSKKFNTELEVYSLSEKIEKAFKKFNVAIEISDWELLEDRIRYTIKLKGSTGKKAFLAHVQDVQDRLRLPVFEVCVEKFTIYIVASDCDPEHPRLPDVLDDPPDDKKLKKAKLPYIVGHNAMGQIVIIDLKESPHVLIGGSTGSGKTVGLQALIISIAYWKKPDEVNFILIDVGAEGLLAFEGLPHLSYPVIRDRGTALRALTALKDEMERRIALAQTDLQTPKAIPRLVVVIDEFPTLFMGETDKKVSQIFSGTISSLLQRGRHAGIHLILAAQNPTCQNMKVDLSNVTTRIAFTCAKKNYSEIILGESGAENLSGQGNLLLKTPQYDRLQRIKGIYIKPRELWSVVQQIKAMYPSVGKFNLILPGLEPEEETDSRSSQPSCSVVRNWPSKEDQLLADAIAWALKREHISVNTVMQRFQLGWNKASRLVERMENLGIVGRPEGKLPREVIPRGPEDIPEDLSAFLTKAGYQSAVPDEIAAEQHP